MKNGKNIPALLLAGLLVLALGGCGKQQEAPEAEIAGGWTEQAEGTAPTQRESEAFAKAVEGTEYADYELVATLGMQVVAGTNFKYLCRTPDGAQKVMVVYNDLQNHCSVTSVEDY